MQQQSVALFLIQGVLGPATIEQVVELYCETVSPGKPYAKKIPVSVQHQASGQLPTSTTTADGFELMGRLSIPDDIALGALGVFCVLLTTRLKVPTVFLKVGSRPFINTKPPAESTSVTLPPEGETRH